MKKKKSWKTTTAAVIGVVTVVLTQAAAVLDNDPSTVANWALATPAIIACVGLLFAKDNAEEA